MIIVSNWKAYVEDLGTARALAKAAGKFVQKNRTVVVVPPTAMVAYVREYASKKVHVGVQDVSDSEGGAATGEQTARVAYGVGVRFAIIGHSERRARGETNESVAHKVRIALETGLTPIVCIGERERDEEAQYLQELNQQLQSAYAQVLPVDRSRIVIAYEPVWAIGKSADEAMTADDLAEMIRYIRKQLEHYLVDAVGAEHVSILYGGSVDATNAKALLTGTGVNGLLIGRASTDVKTFSALMKVIG